MCVEGHISENGWLLGKWKLDVQIVSEVGEIVAKKSNYTGRAGPPAAMSMEMGGKTGRWKTWSKLDKCVVAAQNLSLFSTLI